MDISRTGARLAGLILAAVVERLTFKAQDLRAAGEVVWSAANKCGVEFEMPIATAEVKRLKNSAFVTDDSDDHVEHAAS